MTATNPHCSLADSKPILEESLRLGILRQVEGDPLVDSRGLLGTPVGRSLIVRSLARHALEYDSDVAIAGVANSGSILAAILADRLNRSFINLLVDGPRKRGLSRQVEPENIVAGQPMLLVDNWITTGSSLQSAARLVVDAGGTVVGAVVVSAKQGFLPESLPFPLHVGIPLAGLLEDRT